MTSSLRHVTVINTSTKYIWRTWERNDWATHQSGSSREKKEKEIKYLGMICLKTQLDSHGLSKKLILLLFMYDNNIHEMITSKIITYWLSHLVARRVVIREDNGDLTEGLSVTQIFIRVMYVPSERRKRMSCTWSA